MKEQRAQTRVVRQAAGEQRCRLDWRTHQASQTVEVGVTGGTGLETVGWALFGRFAPRPREEATGWNSSSFDENAVCCDDVSRCAKWKRIACCRTRCARGPSKEANDAAM